MLTMDNLQKPIAIVGIAVEVPSGHSAQSNLSHDTFFDFLLSKKQAYQEFPSDRLGADLYSGRNLGQSITTVGTFLKDIHLFDPAEFGITAKDAKAMALGTRKLIETTFLALLDSGIDYRGRNVGAYMSAVAIDTLSMARADVYDPRGSFAGYPYMVANKVSFHLDLLGPSIPVDTACSSTMTALHLAVQAIRAGDCESAVVGGCQLNHRSSILFSTVKDLCWLPMESANHLTPLPMDFLAVKESEPSFSNHWKTPSVTEITSMLRFLALESIPAGSAAPVSAPVAEAQMDAMRRAYAGTGRLPQEVDYMELHATGTAVGDPVEANWVGTEFRREGQLLVGSVKGNIGHLEIMSFLASLSKVCSMFRFRTIPPTVNIQTLNPAIRWEEYDLKVPVETTSLKARHPSGKALISMSSSGIGGVNGHAVLEGPPAFPMSEQLHVPAHFPILLVTAGLSPRSASEIGDTLVTAISPSDPKTLRALSVIYGRRSRQMTWRSAAVYLPGQGPTTFPAPRHSSRKKKPLVFVFPGQGPQHMQMGRQLFKYYTPFRESILRMDRIYAEYTGASIIEQTGLFAEIDCPTTQLPEIWPISITLPALAMLQMALCDLFAAVGIVPDVVIGHSAGETAILYASGAASQTVALQLAISRGIAMSYVEGDGSMAAISCSASDAQALIDVVLKRSDSGVLEVACHNARDAVTLAGTTTLIDESVALATERGIFARKLRTNVPVHSSLMEGCRAQYQDAVGAVFTGDHGLLRPRTRTYSALTGEAWQDQFSAEYFWSNTRLPVLFSQAMDALVADIPNASFLEISPHPTLGSYIQTVDASLSVISPLKRVKVSEEFDEVQTFLSAIGGLVVEGYNGTNFSTLVPHWDAAAKIPLPPYPFARKPIAYLPDMSDEGEKRQGPLNGLRIGLNSLTHPALAQHVIRNEAIMPAAGFIEMAFEFGAKYLWNVQFDSIMPLFQERILRAQVLQDGHHWSVRSWKSGSEANNMTPGIQPTRLHAHGYMSPTIPSSSVADDLDIDAIRRRCTKLDMEGFYEKMVYFAQFGKAYQRVTGCYLSDSEGLLRIRASVEDIADEGSYHFNPIVLDSCLHALVHPVFTRNLDQSVYYLPASVQMVILHRSFNHENLPSTLYAHAQLREWEPESTTWDLSITDPNGSRLCTLKGLRVALHQISAPLRAETHFKLVYQAKANQRHRGNFDAFSSIAAAQDIGASLSIFHKMLRTIVEVDRKQIVRVLILNFGHADVDAGFYKTSDGALVDYTVGTIKGGSGVSPENVRRITFDPDVPLPDQKSMFDVIVALNIAATSRPGDPAEFMESLHRCLHPGGYVVVRQIAETDSSSLQCGSLWHHASLHANFLGVELHPCTAADATAFVLAAQKSSWPTLPWNSPGTEFPTVIEFALDDVLLHQQLIHQYDGPTLWISATSGVEDGAALGFARSLRREMHSTAVFLVLFDPIWPPTTRLSIIGDLAANPDVEEETLINADGRACVPRLVRCSAKAAPRDLDPEQYWRLKSGTILVESSPSVPDRSVLVRVTNLSFTLGCLQGFSGVISDPGATSWTPESLVVGVVDSDLISNHFVVHEAQIVATPDGAADQFAVCAVPLVILALTLGPEYLRTPDRLRGRKFLVTNAAEQIGRCLAALLSRLGSDLEIFAGESIDIPLSTIQGSDVIFSGYSSAEDIQVVESAMNPGASVMWWNGPALAREMRRNPWVVTDVLSALHHLDVTTIVDLGLASPTPDAYLALTCSSRLVLRTPVFKSDRSYLLIGGVGSLGLTIAWWMYQSGARHIILTSRSGEESLARDKNTAAVRLLTYLRTRPELSLRLEACDAASSSATAALVQDIHPPLAGCMLLAVIFSDRAFVLHTADTFYVPFAGKTGAMKALDEAVTISSLDFLVALSSVTGLFGSPGQTNYAGANTAVDALIQTYPNAISIVAPAILDSNFLIDQKNLTSDSRFKMWTAWGVTSRHLCDCIEDAILELNHATTSNNRIYLPDVDWEGLRQQLGDSRMYGHFLKGPDASVEGLSGASKSSVLDIVRQMAVQVLYVDPNEFDADVPFTSYGLDSLSAGRLAFMLKPYLSITQVQLLSDLSLADVWQKIELSEQTMASDQNGGGVNKGRFNWSALNQPGETVVPLVEGEGNPLIVIHGTSGNIVALIPLQERFNSPLWAIQTTPETPLDSLEAMTLFYFQQIKARRPVGPYRLAAFSGISLIAAQLALHFERNGDHCVQLAMIDHFPTLFSLPELLPLDMDTVAAHAPSQTLISAAFDQLFDLYGRDPSPTRQVIQEQLQNVLAGLPVPDSIRAYHQVFVKILTMIVRFVLDLPDDGTGRTARFEAWLRQVQAPVTVFVADNGVVPSIEAGPGWEDLGARKCFPDARVTFIKSGHFTTLETDEVVQGLEHGW
ncbi:putative polyketide synthase [Mycena galericulata]|nr:putative polyketide synthase [Mycena galericulata]